MDVVLQPVLRVILELASSLSAVFDSRATVVAGFGASIEVDPALVRFVEVLPGSLPGTVYITVEIEPPELPCEIIETGFLSYCVNGTIVEQPPVPVAIDAPLLGETLPVVQR